MKSTTPLAALALVLALLTGCDAGGVGASPQPSDIVAALEGPLESHLRAATEDGDAALEVFLEWGIDMRIVTDFDRTPLSEAARGGAYDTLAYLIDRGAETSLRDTFGTTPLGWVVYYEQDDCVELLEAAGATM